MRSIPLIAAGVAALTLAGCDAYQQGYDQAHQKAVAEDEAQAATDPPEATDAQPTQGPAEPAPPAT